MVTSVSAASNLISHQQIVLHTDSTSKKAASTSHFTMHNVITLPRTVRTLSIGERLTSAESHTHTQKKNQKDGTKLNYSLFANIWSS